MGDETKPGSTPAAVEPTDSDLFAHMVEGYAYCRMRFERDTPVDFFYLDVNPAFEHLTGLGNVKGRWVSEVIPGIRESDPELFAIYGRVARTRVSERFEVFVAALEEWFAISVFSPRPDHFIALFEVTTGRKRTEQERDQVAQQLRFALEAARLGWWHYDPATQVSRYSARYAEIFEVEGDECDNAIILARMHPDDRPQVWAAVEAALNPRQPAPYATHFRIRLSSGVERWVEAHGMARFEGEAEQRRVTAFEGTLEDITERKHDGRGRRANPGFPGLHRPRAP